MHYRSGQVVYQHMGAGVWRRGSVLTVERVIDRCGNASSLYEVAFSWHVGGDHTTMILFVDAADLTSHRPACTCDTQTHIPCPLHPHTYGVKFDEARTA